MEKRICVIAKITPVKTKYACEKSEKMPKKTGLKSIFLPVKKKNQKDAKKGFDSHFFSRPKKKHWILKRKSEKRISTENRK